jgi:hypothetical protein
MIHNMSYGVTVLEGEAKSVFTYLSMNKGNGSQVVDVRLVYCDVMLFL